MIPKSSHPDTIKNKLSKRVKRIAHSATLKALQEAEELKHKYDDVIDLGLGESDFNTPKYVKYAGINAIVNNHTRYTRVCGLLELREVICRKFKKENDLRYSPSQVIVSTGAKEVLLNSLWALCNEGDEVLLPVPYWSTYLWQIKLMSAKPVFVPTREKEGFILKADELRKHITPKTKLLVLNTPNNPTGAVIPKSELKRIADVLIEHNVFVISDEIYEKYVYGGTKHYSIASLNDEIKDLAVTVNGLSKNYSMGGWRLGYGAGPRELINVMGRIQDATTSNANTISQMAAITALSRAPRELCKRMRIFEDRKKYIYKRLKEIDGITCSKPKGAFYVFPNVKNLFGKKLNGEVMTHSLDVTRHLLKHKHVVTVPGSAFGNDEHVRISYIQDVTKLRQAMLRLESMFKENGTNNSQETASS